MKFQECINYLKETLPRGFVKTSNGTGHLFPDVLEVKTLGNGYSNQIGTINVRNVKDDVGLQIPLGMIRTNGAWEGGCSSHFVPLYYHSFTC
jgi:hypothetical protein